MRHGFSIVKTAAMKGDELWLPREYLVNSSLLFWWALPYFLQRQQTSLTWRLYHFVFWYVFVFAAVPRKQHHLEVSRIMDNRKRSVNYFLLDG